MKKLSFILRVISSFLVALVALVFTVLETTLLITLDFNLYENELLALLQLMLRLFIAACALALGVTSLIKIERAFLYESICLLALSVVTIPFVNNGFGIYFTVISALFVLSHILYTKTQKKIVT